MSVLSWCRSSRRVDTDASVGLCGVSRYKEQYALFQEIVRVYESDEGNMNLLLELMTKAQDYGQPPREVLEELVPGGLGSNGLPLPPGMTEGGEPCSIM